MPHCYFIQIFFFFTSCSLLFLFFGDSLWQCYSATSGLACILQCFRICADTHISYESAFIYFFKFFYKQIRNRSTGFLCGHGGNSSSVHTTDFLSPPPLLLIHVYINQSFRSLFWINSYGGVSAPLQAWHTYCSFSTSAWTPTFLVK